MEGIIPAEKEKSETGDCVPTSSDPTTHENTNPLDCNQSRVVVGAILVSRSQLGEPSDDRPRTTSAGPQHLLVEHQIEQAAPVDVLGSPGAVINGKISFTSLRRPVVGLAGTNLGTVPTTVPISSASSCLEIGSHRVRSVP